MNRMNQMLDLFGTVSGVLGATAALAAAIVRIAMGPGNNPGIYVAPRNILLGGIALMVFGCWLKLTAKKD